MLLSFRVSNFLSFNKEEEFSMLAGQVKSSASHVTQLSSGSGSIDVVRSALIYGANGSGKSNLIKAIDFAKNVTINGLINTPSHNQQFRLKKSAEHHLSKFEFEFKAGERIYSYGFELLLNSKKIAEEWLFEVKKTTDKAIFERKVEPNGNSVFSSKPPLKGKHSTRFDVYANDLSEDQLLLSVLGSKKSEGFESFHDAYDWIDNSLVLIWPHSLYGEMHTVFQNENVKDAYCELLKYFKTDIMGFENHQINADETLSRFSSKRRAKIEADLVEAGTVSMQLGGKKVLLKKDEDGKMIAEKIMTKHLGHHGEDAVSFEFEDESDGTRRLFDLIPILIGLNIKGVPPLTYIVDEIDRSLHPELTRKFIEAFLSSTGQPFSQLVLTTHESSLLDLDLLRRDEIWFVEKSTDGASHLYSLEEFKPRFDTEIRKAYLQGRYGAIPFISDTNQLGWSQN
ncbi:MAG: AAA family ATPase [Saprospiraceae bacterium]